MRPIFCGNIEFDARQGDLERLFRKYGKVDRVDMKSGFAFIYMEDERDADDAIRALDRYEFGRKGRRLRVEWTKQERNVRQPASSRKSSSNSRPSKTLFVINFDPYNTRTRDLERHFDSYGKVLNIRIRKNFGFIQFESQEDATNALEATNQSKLMDRVITVEYARDDDDRKNGNGSGGRDRSPHRRGDERGRSPSPYTRERGSPDYGRGRNRGSPDYGRGRGRSPSPRRKDRSSPDYGPGVNGKGRAWNADHRRDASPKERVSPEYEQGAIVSPRSEGVIESPRERRSPDMHRDSPGHSGAESPPGGFDKS
ncbi:putative RNA recognition motif domain, nucleotide-binding alpha-beta plait domain superfamily [Helianthus debilis subsp. tardiflorus]